MNPSKTAHDVILHSIQIIITVLGIETVKLSSEIALPGLFSDLCVDKNASGKQTGRKIMNKMIPIFMGTTSYYDRSIKSYSVSAIFL